MRPAGSQTLLTSMGSGGYTGTFDLPLYRLGGIKLVTTPNTNPVRYQEDIDTNGDGIYDATQPGTFPAGFFHLSADATGSAAYTNLYGLAHFNKDIELGPVRTAQSGNVAVGITSVTAGGNVTIESARYTLKQPGYKMANSNTIYEIKTTAVFTGPVYLKIGFCEAGYSAIQRSTPTIFHCDAGMACTPVDTRLDGQCTAAATVYSLSPFGVMVPIDDITPPHTGVEFIGTNNLVGVGLWVTTETYINLNSNDNTNIGDISGVATTYYLLDTAPTPDCLAAPYDPGAPYGACANSRYTGAFTLTEGSHTITYLSADNWGNREQPASKSLFVDGTSPVTTFTANGVEAQAGKTVNIIWTDSVTLTAVDPVSGGVASGFNRTQYLIDTDPASCGGAEMDPAAPGGSCQYEPYNGPFTLSAGLHSLYFRSIDNVENIEPFQKIDVNCAGDLTPPTVTLSLNGVDVSTFATVNALATDSITITAVDPAVDVFISGVKAAYYLIDVTTATCQTPPDLIGPVGTCRNPVYAGVFTLEAGSHTIYYTAEDNAGNVAEGKSVSINVHSFGFKGSAQAWDSVLWAWNLKAGATAYQVVSTTGGAISPILAADASSYLQLGLSPNTRYSNFIRSYGDTVSESAPFEAVTLANIPISIESFTSGQSASVVIGQSGFYSNSPSAGTTGLSLPEGVTLDAGGNLWVADRYNHRVLRFSPPFTTGMSANLSIGQTNLYLNLAPAFRAPDSLSQPESLAFDKNGNLWVADGYSGYSRVLRFSPPFFTGMSANLVIGAPDFYSYYSLIPSALNFSNLYLHVGVDSTNAVWVSDAGNHRVLRFSPPFTNGMPADLVIGQPDFISYSAGPPATATGLYGPAGIAFDGEDSLWVSDEFNNRVLKFEKPFVNGKAATLAIGQPDLYSPQSYSIVPPAQNTLNRPMALSFDVLGNIYTLEYGNNRVLRFSPPFSNNMNADMVIGQADFTSRLAALTPANFQSPRMGDVKVSGFIITDAHGRMWVADTSNNRVLLFESGKVRAFSRIGVSSFTTQWDGNFNPAQTIYNAEASKSADFSANIIGSGDISALEYTFTGVSGDSKYYVRVKAKNIAGVGSAYGFLGSVVTKPDIPTGFAGIVQSSNSILWNWNTPGGVSNYQIFNSTGLAVSPVLPPGTTYYAQTGLLPNNIYSDFLRVSNESGAAESSPAGQMTFAALPGQPEIFSNGQEADFVIGQPDFTSSLLGPSANRLNFPLGMAKDVNGNLWVLDKCRVLRFAPPFRTNMSADTVLGQSDFGSATCGVGRNKFAYPYPPGMMAFDPENRLWVSDTANNRVLMFNPPFSNGMDADLVLGQSDFNSQGYGAGTNRVLSSLN